MKKMISTGNDIIFTDATDTARTSEIRFYSRIITNSELQLYKQLTSSISFAIYLWLLWSVKESAYKYLQRLTTGLVFSPKKFIITDLQLPEGFEITGFSLTEIQETGFKDHSAAKGIINYENSQLYFHSLIRNGIIMSVVNEKESFSNVSWGIKSIEKNDPGYQSLAVREFVITRLKEVYRTHDIEINKSPYGFPVIMKHNRETAIPVSLSHHHHLIAYSFPL